MRDDWERATLGNLISVQHGWPFKSEEFSEQLTGRPIVVAVGNFRYEGGFRFDSTATKEYRGDYPKSFELIPGDLLLIMTCQTQGGEILGIPARIPDDGRTYLHNQRLGKVVIREPSLIDTGFLYHLFRSRDFNSALCATASGSKILHTAPTRIEAYEFLLPPINTQRAIADTLGSLDQKMEQNRRTGAKLEGLARAVFKAWFVDFEPVKAKAAGATTFPGMSPETFAALPTRLVDSELGPVPAGWQVMPFEQLVVGVYDGPHATPPEASAGPVFLGIKNLTGTQIDLSEIRHISEDDWPRWTKRVTPSHGDIVFTYEATIGFFAMIPPRLKCCLGRRMALLRPKKDVDSHYLYHYATSSPFQRLLAERTVNGSTVNRTSLTEFPKYPVLWATSTIRNEFRRFAEPIWELIHIFQAESIKLATLRDYLLPRLLSGRVRVAALNTPTPTAQTKVEVCRGKF